MRDLYKSVDHIQRGVLRGLERLERKATSLPKEMLATRPKSSIRGWRAPVSASDVVYPAQVFRPRNQLKFASRDAPGAMSGDTPNTPNAQPNTNSRDTSRSTSLTTKLTLSARALKITVPLDVMEVRVLPDPGNQARCQLSIACEGTRYTADIATKALRKAKSTISANGAENTFVMIQGKLKGNEIIECGLVAQVKTPKPAVEAKPVETKPEVKPVAPASAA
jgi:hypothetical protein